MNGQLIEAVQVDWNKVSPYSNVRQIEALQGVQEIDFSHAVTLFVGENGSGKSTLLEAMAVAHGFNPEGGTMNYHFSTHDSHSELCDAIRLVHGPFREKWGYFLRAESFYNVATQEEHYAKSGPGAPSEHYHQQSHGESFLSLAQKHLKPHGLYFLDEPEAALSPQRQLSLMIMIHQCAMRGAQFFIVSHSPILLALPDAVIYAFDDGPLHEIAYEETESYQVTDMLINNREAVLRRLLEE